MLEVGAGLGDRRTLPPPNTIIGMERGPCHEERSTLIKEAVAASLELSEWISEHHPPMVPHSTRDTMAAVLYSVAIDHREAILLLFRHGARSSAHALSRSLFEAYFRASWVQHCATEQELARAVDEGVVPGVDAMVRRLDANPITRGNFGKTKRIVWGPLSDFLHGGMGQVARWVGEEGIAPRHDERECVTLLQTVDVYGIFACLGVASLAGMDNAAHVAKASEAVQRLGSAWIDTEPP